jgi:hypothetical protein
MRVKSLDIGVEAISRWQVDDEFHLPEQRGYRPTFLPLHRPLDEILRRPSLDERLPQLLQPALIDPELLEPATLTDTRLNMRRILSEHTPHEIGARRRVLEAATAYLDDDAAFDDEIRRSLAALLKG